jgi:hypothetical protein
MTTPPDFLGKQVGVVEVAVGATVIQLPVSTLRFTPGPRDSRSRLAGGFFDDGDGHVGIIVDSDATPRQVNEQIRVAVEDAVAHFDKRTLS